MSGTAIYIQPSASIGKTVYMTTDQVVNDTSTVSTLTIPVQAGKRYVFTATLRCGAAAGGVRVGINLPAGSTSNYISYGNGINRSSIVYSADQNSFGAVNGSNNFGTYTSSLGLVKLEGEFVAGPSNGFLTILFSSSTGAVVATAYANGSRLTLTPKS